MKRGIGILGRLLSHIRHHVPGIAAVYPGIAPFTRHTTVAVWSNSSKMIAFFLSYAPFRIGSL